MQEHRQAISRYVILVDGGAVSWGSKKQNLVTLSTMEAEYIATTHATKELIWFWCLLSEIFRCDRVTGGLGPFSLVIPFNSNFHSFPVFQQLDYTFSPPFAGSARFRKVTPFHRPLEHPIILHSDNQSAIALAHSQRQFHAQTKHINIQWHFIHFLIENGSIELIYCPTEDMTADLLTKLLPSTKARHFAHLIGLLSV
jgi:hypothetical protein